MNLKDISQKAKLSLKMKDITEINVKDIYSVLGRNSALLMRPGVYLTVSKRAFFLFQIQKLVPDVLSSQSWQGNQNHDQASEEEVKVNKRFGEIKKQVNGANS